MTRSTKPEEGTKVGQGGERTLAIIPDIIQRVTVDQAFKNTLMRFPPSNWKRIAVSTIRLLISIPSKLTIDFFFFLLLLSLSIGYYTMLTFYCRRLCELIWHRLPRRPINHYRRWNRKKIESLLGWVRAFFTEYSKS